MSPLESATVRRKLARMLESLEQLRTVERMSVADWKADVVRRSAAERWLQIGIEAAIDVYAHLLVAGGHPAPADAYQSFLQLASQPHVIQDDLAKELAPSAGLRNRLIHRYDDIDDALVPRGVATTLRLFPQYVEAVSRFVDASAK